MRAKARNYMYVEGQRDMKLFDRAMFAGSGYPWFHY